MLVLDHLHQRIHNNLPDETTLHNGQKFDLLGLGLLGVPQLSEHFNELQHKLVELKFDVGDYICMKFLLLLNPGECTNHQPLTQKWWGAKRIQRQTCSNCPKRSIRKKWTFRLCVVFQSKNNFFNRFECAVVVCVFFCIS